MRKLRKPLSWLLAVCMLFSLLPGTALAADPDVQIIRLAPVGKMPTLASIGPLPGTYPVTEFPIPDKGAGQLRRERDDCDQGLRSCQAFLTEAAKHLPSIHDQMLKTQNAAEYSSVSNTSQSQDGLVLSLIHI